MIRAAVANRLIFLLSLMGLAVSSFLLYEYNFASSIVCPTGVGCDVVRSSPYSSFFGISTPILGIAYYLFMAFASVVRSHNLDHALLKKLKLMSASAAFTFSLYLTYLEGFVINAYCFWCILSFIISTAIFFLVLAPIIKVKRHELRN